MIQKRVESGKKFEIEKSIQTKSKIKNQKPIFGYVSNGQQMTLQRKKDMPKEIKKGNIVDLLESKRNGTLEKINLILCNKYDLENSYKIKREVKKYNSKSLKNGIVYSEFGNIKNPSQLKNIKMSPQEHNEILKEMLADFNLDLIKIGEDILSSTDLVTFIDKEIETDMLRIIPKIERGWEGYDRLKFVIYNK